MAAMTEGSVYFQYTDASGTQHTVTLTYDATVQDSNGNTVGGWVGTETLPLGSSFKQSIKRNVGGETNVGVFSASMWAVNNAGTQSSTYTMNTSGFEALGLRVKETVAPSVQALTPTANQKFDTATPTFRVKVKDVGALNALATSESAGDAGLNYNSVSITLDGTTYSGSTLGAAFTLTNDNGAGGDGVILSATPKTPLSAVSPNQNHTITVSINDNDGNTGTTGAISFTCDVSAPTLSVTSPASTSVVTAASSYHIIGTTTDDETSPVTVTVSVDGTEYSATAGAGGAFDITVQLTTGATNNVTVTATNSVGLSTTWTGVIIQNNTVPVFDWVRIEDNPTTAGSVITITAFVSNGSSS